MASVDREDREDEEKLRFFRSPRVQVENLGEGALKKELERWKPKEDEEVKKAQESLQKAPYAIVRRMRSNFRGPNQEPEHLTREEFAAKFGK